MSAAIAITAISTVLNGKSTPFRMPKAAPLFSTCVKSTRPGMMVTLSCSGSDAFTIALVAWSTVTIIIGSHTSRCRRGDAAASTSPGAIALSPPRALSMDGLGDRVLAAVAQAGKVRIGRDRGDVAPAALAFHPAGPLDGDARLRLGMRLHVVGRRADFDLGDDEQHRQLLRVLLEQRQLGPGG